MEQSLTDMLTYAIIPLQIEAYDLLQSVAMNDIEKSTGDTLVFSSSLAWLHFPLKSVSPCILHK